MALPLVCLLLFVFTSCNNETPLIPRSTTLAQSDDYKPSIYPVSFDQITNVNGYGERVNPITKKNDFHHAIDFAAKEGEEVMATANGVVVEAKFDEEKGMGNYILVKHDDVYSTFYAHLKSLKVKDGDILKKGQVIGYVGSTGISTGSHVHYEVHKNGERVNPKDYLPK